MKIYKIILIVFCILSLGVGSFYLTFKLDEGRIDYAEEVRIFLKSADFNSEHNECLELGYYGRISDREVLKCLKKIK